VNHFHPMSGITDNRGYRDVVARIRDIVSGIVPPEATVIVVSKGDPELVKLHGRRAWHFPQGHDGTYAGYHPADSNSAIQHLESLKARGADYLIIPQTSLWWLDHYSDFRLHLERHYKSVVHQEDTCVMFALRGSPSDAEPLETRNVRHTGPVQRNAGARGAKYGKRISDYVNDASVPDLQTLFDANYYQQQTGIAFASADAAMIHYIEHGFKYGYNPHPLFETNYYLDEYPAVRVSGANPLLHFISCGALEGCNPSPWFDTEYYCGHDRSLVEHGVNALVHYVKYGQTGQSYGPNPLFNSGYYRSQYSDVRDGKWNPLAHYLTVGWKEARYVSPVHRNLVNGLADWKTSLLRGMWKRGTVLLFSYGEHRSGAPLLLEVGQTLSADYHLHCITVCLRRESWVEYMQQGAKVLFLDETQLACDVSRPSALRLLTKTLCSLQPLLTICEVPDILYTLKRHGVPVYYLYPAFASFYSQQTLKTLFEAAGRTLFSSSGDFHALGKRLGYHPPKVALRPYNRESTTGGSSATCGHPTRQGDIKKYVQSVMQLAARDFHLPPQHGDATSSRNAATTNKVIIPCSDWSVSGVNSSLEAIGQELVHRGWSVEIVFTRTRSAVLASAGSEDRMPSLPYRYLEANAPGIEGMWMALISYLEDNAPCIVFTAYDFTANSIAPALTEKVGVVTWVQADDGDYYEQTYRLGRYCNAIVCVSERIRQQIHELNPAIGGRTQVIHNTSVRAEDIVQDKLLPSHTLNVVYSGRLVQYQKRILDIVHLANALDKLKVPYRITLIGDFAANEDTRSLFHARGSAHINSGRIALLGRLRRDEVLSEMKRQDIFVLLSDFEGLPLAMIEGMACGCVPVVAQMSSGIPDVITHGYNGLVIGGRDYNDWAAAIVNLWNNPTEILRLSHNARETVRSRFTVEQTGIAFDALFLEVAHEICSGAYVRPPCLRWGNARSMTGDVLPPPSLYRPLLDSPPGYR
jgi:glycosyltransferase involved in cell wall biosynthesis